MKEILKTIRIVLNDLVATNNSVFCQDVEKSCELEDVYGALSMLQTYDFIVNESDGSIADFSYIRVSDFGRNLHEKIRNDERWALVISVCDQIDDHSFDSALKVLDSIIANQITKALTQKQ